MLNKVVDDQVVGSFGLRSIHVCIVEFTKELYDIILVNEVLGRVKFINSLQLARIFDLLI